MSNTVQFNFGPTTSSTMDTPEADISAIQAGTMRPLPTYTEHNDNERLLISAADPSDTRHIPPTYEKNDPSPSSTHNSEQPEASSSSKLEGLVNGADSIHSAPSVNGNGVEDFPILSISHSQSPVDANDELAKAKAKVVEGFFEAIRKGQGDVVDLFLSRNLITANTVNQMGKTPLLEAVSTKNIKIVQQLLDAGAEPDTFGVVSREDRYGRHNYHLKPYTLILRTPLQQSAAIGHLPLVKLFLERYACNDALIAPDGQIALRLAASNGHREVVDYLPSRRGGGFLRWKTAHQKSLDRARRALHQMYGFIKFFVWDIEKFFLWTVPKHVIVLPVVKSCKYCWNNKERFGRWCICEIKKGPERARKAARAVGRGVQACGRGIKACGRGILKIPHFISQISKAAWIQAKKIPGALHKAAKWTRDLLVEIAKATWKFITVDLPAAVVKISKWIYQLLFVRLPKAVSITAKYIYHGIASTLTSIVNIITRFLSLIHTFITSLSLRDILNGIQALLSAIFITFPKTVWGWIEGFGEASYKVMKALFGCIGECVWWVIRGIGYLVNYLPRKIWTIIVAFGESIGKGGHEILVWFRPKA